MPQFVILQLDRISVNWETRGADAQQGLEQEYAGQHKLHGVESVREAQVPAGFVEGHDGQVGQNQNACGCVEPAPVDCV